MSGLASSLLSYTLFPALSAGSSYMAITVFSLGASLRTRVDCGVLDSGAAGAGVSLLFDILLINSS